MHFACFYAAGANFQALDRIANLRLDRLQVWQPAALVVRVPVRPQESVVIAGCRTFSADVATFSHG